MISKMRLIFLFLILSLGVVCGSPSPAKARVREQLDREDEEGMDRVRFKTRDQKVGEAGNREREIQAFAKEMTKNGVGGAGVGWVPPSPNQTNGKGKDNKLADKVMDDIARFALQKDIEFSKDTYRKKSKTSHKKEEIFSTI